MDRDEVQGAESDMLRELRSARRAQRDSDGMLCPALKANWSERVADRVAGIMGSWRFIVIQSTILVFWIGLNIAAFSFKWDPYPFILLNLGLSFQAAYAAPFIMMSQNRQQDLDRKELQLDYEINIKAELEIELLHQKIDELREKEILMLTGAVNDLTALLAAQGLTARRDG